jgi:hypothetical protein
MFLQDFDDILSSTYEYDHTEDVRYRKSCHKDIQSNCVLTSRVQFYRAMLLKFHLEL